MSRRDAEEELRASPRAILILIGLIITIIAVAIIGATTTYSIPVSSVGVLFDTYSGHVTGPINPGTQFFSKAPWVNLITISTSTQTVTFLGNTTGIFVLSQDNLEIEFDVNFRYSVDGSQALALYEKYPSLNWEQAALDPHIRAAFRDIVATFNADQIQLFRAIIQTGVETELSTQIGNDTSLANAIHIISTQIVDITLPQSFTNAIQAKLNAQQALLQAQFEAQKTITLAEGQANATIAQAKGTAEAQIIQANGIRNATIIEATGTQQALNLITSGVTNQTLRAQIINTYILMQQLQVLCAETNNPCQNMILFVNGSNGQIFEFPVGSKP